MPRISIAPVGPIGFEEFSPQSGTPIRVSNQYEQARGVVFNPEVDVSEFPAGFAHSGTRAIVRCWGVEFGCDPRFVFTFSKPQRRVKIWFGFSQAVERADAVVLRIFKSADGSGSSTAEASAPLALSDRSIPVTRELEATSESADILSATVSLRNDVAGFSQLVLDDIEFDEGSTQSDLTFESLQAQVGSDRQLIVTAVVKNIGASPSAATTLELTQSRYWDTSPSAGVPPLDPGATASVTLQTTLSARRPGPYPYTVVIDPQGTIPDADRTNNSRSDRFEMLRGKPDLSVKLLNSGVNQYQAYVIAEVKNVGNVVSPATIARLELDGAVISTTTVKSLAPEESVEVNLVTAQKPPSGQHSFEVKVNYDQSVDESDLTNNSATGMLTVRSNWVEDPRVPIGIGILILILTVTGVTVSVNRRIKRRRARRNDQQAHQPPLTGPTFVARPKVDLGEQQLSLSHPDRPSFAVRLRPRSGESLQEIFDRPGRASRGES